MYNASRSWNQVVGIRFNENFVPESSENENTQHIGAKQPWEEMMHCFIAWFYIRISYLKLQVYFWQTKRNYEQWKISLTATRTFVF